MKLFGARSHPFVSSEVIFLQTKWSKIKERVEGWRSGKKLPFKRTTVCITPKHNLPYHNRHALANTDSASRQAFCLWRKFQK